MQIAPRHRRILEALLRKHLTGVEVWAYGSRVNGRGHDGSDLDLVLRAPDLKKLPAGQLLDFEDAVRESTIPFLVEAQDWACLPERFHKEIERGYVVMSDGAASKAERRQGVAWYAQPQKRSTLPSGTTHPRGLPPVEAISWPLVPARDLFGLTYGRALAAPNRRPGNVPVYGTNGQCGTHDAALFGGPGVILGRKGQGPLGVEWSRGPYWVIDTAYTLTPLRPDVDLKFAYYLLKFIGLNHLKDGTSNPTLGRETFGAQALPFPPVPSQRAIAHILGTLDDKIELNRRMNATLEAMARALFKSWFVDFDPVRAKMGGRDTGLPNEVADLFPDRLVDSKLGEIPEGWQLKPLDAVARFRNGLALQNFRPSPNAARLPVVKIAQLRSGEANSGEWASATITPECIIEDGDVVFSWSGSLLVRTWCGGPAALNQHLFKVTSERYPKWYYLHSILSHFPEFERIAADKATTMGHIRRHHLSDALCIVPPGRMVARVTGMLGRLVERQVANDVAGRTLTALRDTLLPKLVSGELRVRDAGRLVGAIS